MKVLAIAAVFLYLLLFFIAVATAKGRSGVMGRILDFIFVLPLLLFWLWKTFWT